MSLTRKARELNRRISQSMRDSGGSTRKCKKLQRKLANAQRRRKNNKERW